MTEHGFEQNKNLTTSTITGSTTSTSTNTTSSSSTTSTSSIHTHPGVFYTEEQWADLSALYEGCIGGIMTMPVMEMMRQAANEHITYEVMRECIKETGFARRPSAYYLRAVLERTIGDGIETLDEWKAAKAEYQYRLRKKWWGGNDR